MKDLEVGQVLSLRIRIDYHGVFKDKHPYLILNIDEEDEIIEVGQMHSAEGKMFEAIDKKNKLVFNNSPDEVVIDKTSFVELHNKITIEYYDGLSRFRRQKEKLSKSKLQDVIKAYRNYQDKHRIDDNRMVYLDKEEIEDLNS